jgi:hypothetical protein
VRGTGRWVWPMRLATSTTGRTEIFSRSSLFTGSIRKRAVPPPSFLSFFRRFVFRAFRDAASRTALRRRGALRESMSERGHRRWPSEFRFAAPTRSIAVSRGAYSPAAFSVPFWAGQKGDLPTEPTERTAIQRRPLQTVLSSNTIDPFVEPGRE